MSDSYQSPYYHSPIDGHDHFTETGRHECAICALETDRDRLRAIIEDVADALTPDHLDPGEWDHAPDAIRDIIAETNLTQAALHRADDIHDRWALAVVERDAAETERDRMRAACDKAVADLEFAEEEFARENRRAVDLKIERDHYYRFATMVGEIVRQVPDDIASIDIETLLRDLPAQIAAIKTERDRLRAGLDAILTGLVGLDSDDAYVAITMEHLNTLRALLRKDGT